MTCCYGLRKAARAGSFACVLVAMSIMPANVLADAKSQLAKETAEFILQRFGKQAVREGAATLAGRLEAMALRHGNEVFLAARKVGPRALHLVEEAGAHGGDAARLLGLYGEQAAVALSKANGLALCLKHGDQVVGAIARHPGIAEPVIEQFGATGIRALEATGPQGARRLAMLMEDGALAKMGRSQEVLGVIGQYGDSALSFVWQHAPALATTAGLAAFLANPEIFISGAKDLVQIVGETAVKPLLQIPGNMVTEVARGTNWTVIFLAAGGVALALAGAKYSLFSRTPRRVPEARKIPIAGPGPASIPVAKLERPRWSGDHRRQHMPKDV